MLHEIKIYEGQLFHEILAEWIQVVISLSPKYVFGLYILSSW